MHDASSAADLGWDAQQADSSTAQHSTAAHAERRSSLMLPPRHKGPAALPAERVGVGGQAQPLGVKHPRQVQVGDLVPGGGGQESGGRGESCRGFVVAEVGG